MSNGNIYVDGTLFVLLCE